MDNGIKDIHRDQTETEDINRKKTIVHKENKVILHQGGEMWHFMTSLQISCKSDPHNQILSQDMQKRRS
jgi:hypothetical protein